CSDPRGASGGCQSEATIPLRVHRNVARGALPLSRTSAFPHLREAAIPQGGAAIPQDVGWAAPALRPAFLMFSTPLLFTCYKQVHQNHCELAGCRTLVSSCQS